MSMVLNTIELIHRQGSAYVTVPIGSELRLVEFLNRSHAVVAEINGIEFILERGQFEEVKMRAFRPPTKRKKNPKVQTG